MASAHQATAAYENANDDAWLMPITPHANSLPAQHTAQPHHPRSAHCATAAFDLANNPEQPPSSHDSLDDNPFFIAEALQEDISAHSAPPQGEQCLFVKREYELYDLDGFPTRVPSPMPTSINVPEHIFPPPSPSVLRHNPYEKHSPVERKFCNAIPAPQTAEHVFDSALEVPKTELSFTNDPSLPPSPPSPALQQSVSDSQQLQPNFSPLSLDVLPKDTGPIVSEFLSPSPSSMGGVRKGSQSSNEGMKPINTLGSTCFAGFYLVTLTRTLIRNHTVPLAVRRAFLAPQINFGFTIRDQRDGKYRHVHTVQIPYDALNTAGEWLRVRLGISTKACTFKQIKDTLQRCLTNAWGNDNWTPLVHRFQADFGDEFNASIDDALRSEAVVGRGFGTPRQFFHLLNCHKGALDIRRDVDGAISARESLKWVLSELGLNVTGNDVPVAQFRDDIFPLWKHHCAYVREHSVANCCSFYCGGYFKKIMTHRHLYDVDGCLSAYHVKDLFEGLEEVIKVWNNPTGMCVREAKCAAGLRYNVDKSFQSGIRSYAKAKFLEAAPHTALEMTTLERRLHQQVQNVVWLKSKKFSKCRRALRQIEIQARAIGNVPVPEALSNQDAGIFSSGSASSAHGIRKRKRQEREQDQDTDVGAPEAEVAVGADPPTPREQKRKHAHLSLKRKEAMELQVKEYLDAVRADCERQQALLDEANGHGEICGCQTAVLDEAVPAGRFVASNNAPVA